MNEMTEYKREHNLMSFVMRNTMQGKFDYAKNGH